MASRISYREGYMASLKSNLRLFFLSNAYKCSGLVCGEKCLESKQSMQSNAKVMCHTCALKRTIHEGHYKTSSVCHFHDEHPNRRLISC